MTESDSTPAPEPTEWPYFTPLPEAVAAGTFGLVVGGFYVPSEEEIRSLTEEQAREMFFLLACRHYLNRCIEHGQYPGTRRVPTSPKRQQQLREQLGQEIAELTERYAWCVSAFATAFGDEAAETLDATVRQRLETEKGINSGLVQRSLF